MALHNINKDKPFIMPSRRVNMNNNPQELEDDAQECVLSLLALRDANRSVTPDTPTPSTVQSEASTGKPSTAYFASKSPPNHPLPINSTLAMLASKPPATLLPKQPPLPSLASHRQSLLANRQSSLPLIAPKPDPALLASILSTEQLCRRINALGAILPYGGSNSWSNSGEQQQQLRARAADTVGIPSSNEPPLLPDFPSITIESILGDSPLITSDDRGLVPDGLWIAMAQMKLCRLKSSDKFGPYKNRELGSVGLCCKYCGGSPGFGRFFPATLRSCAQTTTSQTMVKHVEQKCRFVPHHIRLAIRELSRIQMKKSVTNAAGRPRYGARKIFFDRVWTRLHSPENCPPEEPEEEEEGIPVGHLTSSPTTPQITSEDEAALDEIQRQGEMSMLNHRKRNRFGALPTSKTNAKRPRT